MLLLDGLLILCLIVGAFFLGRHITIHDYENLINYYNYFYRMDAAKHGVGYVAPPAKRRAQIGDQFMERLKTTGHATQSLTK